MRIDFSRFIEASKHLPDGVAWAEINADLREETTLFVKDGAQTGCENLERTAVYLRASDGEKIGTVYTEQLDDDPVKLMKSAVRNASFIDARSHDEPHKSGGVSLGEIKDDADTAQMLALALEIESAVKARDEKAGVGRLSVRRTTMYRRVTNSFGFDSYQQHRFYLAELRAELSREDNPRGVHATAKASAERLCDIDAHALAAKAVDNANRSDANGTLQQAAIASGKYDCVLSAEVTSNIFNTAWQELAGGYMAGNKAIFPPEPGTQIGSACLNIIDAPSAPGWGYYLALDSEGTVCEDKYLVKNGKLVTPMHTLSTAKAQGHAPTGNAGRVALLTGTVPVNIITVPSIVYVEPGEKSERELIEQMGTGLLLTYSLDQFHALNIASGEFSIPCGGVVYENGVPTGTVEQITIAGNLRDLLNNIAQVGRDLQLDEFLYKNYCFGGPSMLVCGLDVSSAD